MSACLVSSRFEHIKCYPVSCRCPVSFRWGPFYFSSSSQLSLWVPFRQNPQTLFLEVKPLAAWLTRWEGGLRLPGLAARCHIHKNSILRFNFIPNRTGRGQPGRIRRRAPSACPRQEETRGSGGSVPTLWLRGGIIRWPVVGRILKREELWYFHLSWSLCWHWDSSVDYIIYVPFDIYVPFIFACCTGYFQISSEA